MVVQMYITVKVIFKYFQLVHAQDATLTQKCVWER